MPIATATGKAALTSAAASPYGDSTSSRPASQRAHTAISQPPGGGWTAAPVSDCGEEEARDHRKRVAVDHLVAVPDRAAEIGDRQESGVLRDPERDGDRSEAAREQIERPKAEDPERKSGRADVAAPAGPPGANDLGHCDLPRCAGPRPGGDGHFEGMLSRPLAPAGFRPCPRRVAGTPRSARYPRRASWRTSRSTTAVLRSASRAVDQGDRAAAPHP